MEQTIWYAAKARTITERPATYDKRSRAQMAREAVLASRTRVFGQTVPMFLT